MKMRKTTRDWTNIIVTLEIMGYEAASRALNEEVRQHTLATTLNLKQTIYVPVNLCWIVDAAEDRIHQEEIAARKAQSNILRFVSY